ncbi:MAG: hypothetical protein QJR02_00420 [Sinobacteraceae bacterium]|nr:hypothetical protein [Nevskiaceae bacterium]
MPDFSYTQPPQDLLMPAGAQWWTTVIYGSGALLFAAYALRLAWRRRSALPLLLLVGAMLTIWLEPVVDLLGNALHPQRGQLNLFTTNGHPVPWAVLLGYVWYFAGLPLVCYPLLEQQRLTRIFVWKAFAVVALAAAVVEQVPLHYGVWVYYGVQPLKIGAMPSWWIFANTSAVLVPFLLLYKLWPRLTGVRQWLVPVLLPSGAFMGHAAAGWPMYNVLGTDTEHASSLLLAACSVASSGLAVVTVWVMLQMADVRTRT